MSAPSPTLPAALSPPPKRPLNRQRSTDPADDEPDDDAPDADPGALDRDIAHRRDRRHARRPQRGEKRREQSDEHADDERGDEAPGLDDRAARGDVETEPARAAPSSRTRARPRAPRPMTAATTTRRQTFEEHARS